MQVMLSEKILGSRNIIIIIMATLFNFSWTVLNEWKFAGRASVI